MFPSLLSFVWVRVLLAVILSVASVLVLKYWWSRRRMRSLASRIPGSRSMTILGDLLEFTGNPKNTFKVFTEKWKKYGPTFRVWFGPFLYVSISDPKDMEVIIGSSKFTVRNSHLTKVIENYFGTGLMTSSGELWKKHREIINPSFESNILEQFISVFNDNAHILVEKLRAYSDGTTFDAFTFTGPCTMDSICEIAMGTRANTIDDNDEDFVNAMHRVTQLIHGAMLLPSLQIEWIFNMTRRGKELKATQKILHGYTEGIIAKKLKTYRDDISTGKKRYVDEKTRLTFLDLLIEASEIQGSVLSQDEIRDEVNTLTMAGQETTATTTCFALTLLAMYPDFQEQVFDELKEIFGDNDWRPVTSSDLCKMKRLEMAILETLRLFPPAPFMPREIDEEVKLSTCTLPAGCTAIGNLHGLHRNPEYFPDPDKFNPDRFLPENIARMHPYCYLPFGGGARICVGQKYAMMQMKTVLAAVLRSYEVFPSVLRKDMDNLEMTMVIKPAGGFRLRMLPR